jgi:hypothetical protein
MPRGPSAVPPAHSTACTNPPAPAAAAALPAVRFDRAQLDAPAATWLDARCSRSQLYLGCTWETASVAAGP